MKKKSFFTVFMSRTIFSVVWKFIFKKRKREDKL